MMKIPWIHHAWVDGLQKLYPGLNWAWDDHSKPELILHLPCITRNVYFRIRTNRVMAKINETSPKVRLNRYRVIFDILNWKQEQLDFRKELRRERKRRINDVIAECNPNLPTYEAK